MASHGIKDRVAIVGMGCTPFKEHWDSGVDDLALDASNEAFTAAGIGKDDVVAALDRHRKRLAKPETIRAGKRRQAP